jgi:hypothetical protein
MREVIPRYVNYRHELHTADHQKQTQSITGRVCGIIWVLNIITDYGQND